MLRLSATLSRPPSDKSIEPKDTRYLPSIEANVESTQLIIAPDEKAPYQRFGHFMATDGTALFVNTNRNNIQGPIYKYCFDKNEEGDVSVVINQVAKLSMPPHDNRGYGLSFAADQGHLLVGARFDKGNQGSVFVYFSDPATCSGDGYTSEMYKLSPTDEGFKNFGSDVAISFPYAIIGAPSDSATVVEGGSAYLFKYTTSMDDQGEGTESGTWTQVSKLMPDDLAPFANFGQSVLISDSWVVVTAPSDSYNYEYAGSAFMYPNDGNWNSYTRIYPNLPFPFMSFGTSSALAGNFAYFSAVNEDTSGVVYAFSYNNKKWTEVGILLPPMPQFSDGFGSSIYSVLDSTGSVAIAFVGAPNIQESAKGDKKCSIGNVYAFGVTTGSKTSYLGSLRSATKSMDDNDTDDSTCNNDAFGASLGYIDTANGNEFLLVGAELASSAHVGKTGKVFVETNLPKLYFEQYVMMSQNPYSDNNSNSNSNSISIFGTSISYSILALVAVLCAMPLIVMTGFLVRRVVGRAKESRSHRSEATLDDMNETDPANAKMNTSDEDQEVDKDSDYISHSTDRENDNSFSAELGECQSNDEFVKRNNKNGENRNLVFSSSTFSPIAPVVKYDTSRPN